MARHCSIPDCGSRFESFKLHRLCELISGDHANSFSHSESKERVTNLYIIVLSLIVVKLIIILNYEGWSSNNVYNMLMESPSCKSIISDQLTRNQLSWIKMAVTFIWLDNFLLLPCMNDRLSFVTLFYMQDYYKHKAIHSLMTTLQY